MIINLNWDSGYEHATDSDRAMLDIGKPEPDGERESNVEHMRRAGVSQLGRPP